ncbi:hypothetical protein SKAU_G00335310 [Synaphobranchus kaupii]|uniref:Uncharacterized protein n=1 Tax=Synaphobranchus kaupii TaxID=118154 RepID=A0A9Q1ELW1_SYNKA|nr:hypothetical protein SKAU_G00335310 [Synaphobranchus kaupii]
MVVNRICVRDFGSGFQHVMQCNILAQELACDGPAARSHSTQKGAHVSDSKMSVTNIPQCTASSSPWTG